MLFFGVISLEMFSRVDLIMKVVLEIYDQSDRVKPSSKIKMTHAIMARAKTVTGALKSC